MVGMKNIMWAGTLSLALAACGGETGTEPETENTGQTEAATADAPETTAFTAPEIPALPPIAEDSLRVDIATLASDDFQGRAPATEGGRKTIEWLETRMKQAGLKPANGDSYRQAVPLVEITADPAQSTLIINSADGGSRELAYREESVYWTKRVVEEVSFENSEMVFVGYGVVAPEYGWNDYEGLDATGKTVVILVNDPGFRTEDPDLFNGRSMTYYGRWTYKFEEAARQGAAAAIVIHQTEPAAYGWGVVEGSWSGPQLDLERPDGGAERAAMEGWIQEETAEAMFAAAGLDFTALQEDALKPDFQPVAMGDLTASGRLVNTINRSSSDNVAGIVEGKTRPDEYILYMAHWDHLGVGEPDGNGDAISNGAVDNATGTAGIIAIAESFANAAEKPDRSILVIGVTAEESGLLGSAYFAEDPFVPLKNIVGGINVDALLPVGLTRDLIVIGYGASELEDLLRAAAETREMYLRPDAEPEKGYFYRSDHISLAKKGVPMLYADSGIDLVEGGEEAGLAAGADYTNNRYHKPADNYDESWNLEGMVNSFEILRDTGAMMAYSDFDPNWYEGNEFRALRDAQKAE